MNPTPQTTRHATGGRMLGLSCGLLALLGVLASCGDDDENAGGSQIEVDGAWARTSPAVMNAGAVYMEIANTGDADDALVGVAVDESVAAIAELHETVIGDGAMGSDTTVAGDMGSATTTGGMMSMQPVDRIVIGAGSTTMLEPGGYHVMLLDLVAPLEAGDTVELTLTFEQAGEQVVTADVRDEAP